MVSVAGKIGGSPETLTKWVRFAELQQIPEERARLVERQRVKELECEVRELNPLYS